MFGRSELDAGNKKTVRLSPEALSKPELIRSIRGLLTFGLRPYPFDNGIELSQQSTPCHQKVRRPFLPIATARAQSPERLVLNTVPLVGAVQRSVFCLPLLSQLFPRKTQGR